MEYTTLLKVIKDKGKKEERKRLCYLECSPYNLYFKDDYFFKYIKVLQTLERHLTGEDVSYELEMISDNELAVERFNNRLNDLPLIPFYSDKRMCIVDIIEYLKTKTNYTWIINALDSIELKLRRFAYSAVEYKQLENLAKDVLKDNKNHKR